MKAPEERQRRLEEIPEIHADPNMDPSYESEEEEEETDDKKQGMSYEIYAIYILLFISLMLLNHSVITLLQFTQRAS